jgi:NAD(P)-dependent dehydrogenase (short-subunit alcohol dehydrogenase family)
MLCRARVHGDSQRVAIGRAQERARRQAVTEFVSRKQAVTINLTNRVAIVTGAGAGLGREHALLLARLGAKVVVNDIGGDLNGLGGSAAAAQKIVDEIVAAGGEAIANNASVTDAEQVQAMVSQTLARWGRVDILVNNAGILRDKTFAKMTLDDFRAVIEVHLMGAVNCTKAVWDVMREQKYGRIVMTTSSSGLYGNFGQSNYSAAKMALVGLMQTLALEGQRYDIRVNCLAPTAGTRMLEGLVSPEAFAALAPDTVSPAVAVLCGDNAPTRTILCAGAGSFEAAHITLTQGVYLGTGEQVPHTLAQRLDEVTARHDESVPLSGSAQLDRELRKAGFTEANAAGHDHA